VVDYRRIINDRWIDISYTGDNWIPGMSIPEYDSIGRR
jgi:hypothetical protein